jgi:hypothetical protein
MRGRKGELVRLIDADALLEGREDHEMISTHLIWNAQTIDAIPISFIENRITELAKERNKYEIGTPPFRFIDVKIYYYEMLMDEWRKENR